MPYDRGEEITSRIKLTPENISSGNLTQHFSDGELDSLGMWVWEGYDRDQQSRTNWLRRNEAGMDLAMQVVQEKSFPWPGCSNVAFPLVTIATLQFHSRAYPSLVSGSQIAKMRVVGEDPDGVQFQRALRVGKHMSYQILEEDHDWEEQHDRGIFNYSIVGTMFKKTFRNGTENRNESDLVLAKDLVIDYWAKSVERAARKTHIIPMYRNEVYSKVKQGLFRDILDEAWYTTIPAPQSSSVKSNEDKRRGTVPPQPDESTPLIFLEQHCRKDLDGDGYAEPYIITIEEVSRKVVRIVTGFDREVDINRNSNGEIISIDCHEYFTKYEFLPSPDGGIYGIGFGVFLGPLNESVNSIVNQLIDAGTLENTAGGFLGRGAKFRSGDNSFSPFQWNRVDSTGDDLKNSIFPLPVRQPSNVLFQLLGLLIDYTNRIAGSTDMQVGENPGQNMKAQTAELMVEQGMKVYAAIFKRHWRSLKEELKKWYKLNQAHMSSRQEIPGGIAYREDYLGDPNQILPVADPNIVSDSMRMQQAAALKQASMTTNGYDREYVEHKYLLALKVDDIPKVYPGPDKVPPLPNPKVMVEQLKVQLGEKKLELQKLEFVANLREQHELNKAQIVLMQAQAAKALEEAGGVKEGHQIAMFEAAIGAAKAHNDAINEQIKLVMEGVKFDAEQSANAGGVHGMAGSPGNMGAPQLAAPQAGAMP